MQSKDGNKTRWISAVMLLVAAFLAPVQGQTQKQASQRTLLHNKVPASVRNLQPVTRVNGSTVLRLSVSLPLRNQDALKILIQQLYDPASPSYHQYLSPEEFTARFGPTDEDYQKVVTWANRSGFTVAAQHSSRMLLEVSAPVANIERALQVTMRTYPHPTEPRTFFAPDSEPSVDANLPILDISGLDNFALPHPKNVRHAPLQNSAKATRKTIGSGPNGNLSGSDYRAAYAPGVALTGAGQIVGLFEFDGFYPKDITNYEALASIPKIPVESNLLDSFNGHPTLGPYSGNGEVALDIELAMSMAPGLTKVVAFEAGPNGNALDVLESMSSAAYTSIKQFSCSWDFGSVDQTSMDNYFMKFASQGQSFFDAVGDFGAYTNGTPIPQPDDDPYITIAGGTTLGTAGPGSPWLSETVWNTQEGPGGYAGAGGISTTYTNIPAWQKGVNMTANHGSTTARNVPDVAAVADNIFIVADNGQQETTGGTSCAAPLWAGFTALANQQAVAAGRPTVGFLNPALYDIGTNSGYTACFNDITVGYNTNNDPTEFLAEPGFDLCTGWGTPSGGSLIIALTQPDGFQITPGRGAVANGPVGGPFSVSSQTFLLANTGKSAFNWVLNTPPAWLNVSSTSGALGSGGSDSVSVSPNSAVNQFAPGVYTANLWLTNLSSGLAQLRQFTVQVDQELVLDGGFEAGDFTYWTLFGDSSIYTNNFVDFTDDPNGLPYSAFEGIYYAALGQSNDLAYLSQPLPTEAGQIYLISYYLQNPNGATPNQFEVQWNTNSTSQNVVFNQTNMGAFAYENFQVVVEAASNTTTLLFGFRNDNDFFCLDDVSVMPVPMPNIQAPTIASGSIQLSWPSFPGLSYQVQFTTSLAPASWANLGGTITASASSTTVSENIGSDSQGFYRVMISQ
jgi:subtilase family serine protease